MEQSPRTLSDLRGWPVSTWPAVEKVDEGSIFIRTKKRLYEIPFPLAERRMPNGAQGLQNDIRQSGRRESAPVRYYGRSLHGLFQELQDEVSY